MSEKDVFALARKRTAVSVDGVHVDPRAVVVSAEFASATADVVVRLTIGESILLHTLSEADEPVTRESIVGFVETDLATHGAVAANAYLQIVQSVARLEGKKRLLGFLLRVPSPLIQWEWSTVTSVYVSDDVVTIQGGAKQVRSAEAGATT